MLGVHAGVGAATGSDGAMLRADVMTDAERRRLRRWNVPRHAAGSTARMAACSPSGEGAGFGSRRAGSDSRSASASARCRSLAGGDGHGPCQRRPGRGRPAGGRTPDTPVESAGRPRAPHGPRARGTQKQKAASGGARRRRVPSGHGGEAPAQWRLVGRGRSRLPGRGGVCDPRDDAAAVRMGRCGRPRMGTRVERDAPDTLHGSCRV